MEVLDDVEILARQTIIKVINSPIEEIGKVPTTINKIDPGPINVLHKPKVLDTDPIRNYDKLTSSSDYKINEDGFLSQFWDKVLTYPAKIIEVFDTVITLELLVDRENEKYELRNFKRSLIEGIVELTSKAIILVTTFERPGKFVFEFEEAKAGLYDKFFEKRDLDIEGINNKARSRSQN